VAELGTEKEKTEQQPTINIQNPTTDSRLPTTDTRQRSVPRHFTISSPTIFDQIYLKHDILCLAFFTPPMIIFSLEGYRIFYLFIITVAFFSFFYAKMQKHP
jgi:hypothetical protein